MSCCCGALANATSTITTKATTMITMQSCDGEVIQAPIELCQYLDTLKLWTDPDMVAVLHGSSPVPLRYVTGRALRLILQFVEHYHVHDPHATIACNKPELDGNNNTGCDVTSVKVKCKRYNSKWFQTVLGTGLGALHETVRAAHFLYNAYLMRVLTSGCESILLNGTCEHARIFLRLSSDDDDGGGDKDAAMQEDDEEDNEWIEWRSVS